MSNKPVLYYVDLSPPCRSVLLTAAAIGVELELKKIDLLAGEHLTPEFLKVCTSKHQYSFTSKIKSSNHRKKYPFLFVLQLNPSHTIPIFVDNGVVIVDSHAICTYLCDKYGKIDSLYPKDLAKRSTVDARLHFDTGFLFCRLRFLYEPVLYNGHPEVDQEKVLYIQKTWDLLEGFLANGDYLCGNELTIADFCCVASVTSVDEAAPIDPAKYPKLTAWLERMSRVPNYQKLNAQGAHELKEIYKSTVQKNKLAAAAKN